MKDNFQEARQLACTLYTRLSKELKSVELAVARLKTKQGWGETVGEFIREGTDTEIKANETFHTDEVLASMLFADKNTLIESKLAEYSEWTSRLQKATSVHEVSYKKYVKEVLGDFVKYCK